MTRDYNLVSITQTQKDDKDLEEFRKIASRTGTSIKSLLDGVGVGVGVDGGGEKVPNKMNKVARMKIEISQRRNLETIMREIESVMSTENCEQIIYSLKTVYARYIALVTMVSYYRYHNMNYAMVLFDDAYRLHKDCREVVLQYIPVDKKAKKELDEIVEKINMVLLEKHGELMTVGKYLYPSDRERDSDNSGVNEAILKGLAHVFPMDKIDSIVNDVQLNEHQKRFIELSATATDVVYCAPPGKGKTASMYFSLARSKRNGLHLIVVPTSALMIQVYADLLKLAQYMGQKVVNMVDFAYSLTDKQPDFLVTTYQYAQKLFLANNEVWLEGKPWKHCRGKNILDNLYAPVAIYMDEIHTITQDMSANVVLSLAVKLACPVFAMSATLAQPEILCDYINKHHRKCELIQDIERWNVAETNAIWAVDNDKLFKTALVNPLQYCDDIDLNNSTSTMCIQALREIGEKVGIYHKCFDYENTLEYGDDELDFSIRLTIDYQKQWERNLKKHVAKMGVDARAALFTSTNVGVGVGVGGGGQLDILKLLQFMRDNDKNPAIICPELPEKCEELVAQIASALDAFEQSEENVLWKKALQKENEIYDKFVDFRKSIEIKIKNEKLQEEQIIQWLNEQGLDSEPKYTDLYTPHDKIQFGINKITFDEIRVCKRQLGHWFHTAIDWESNVVKLMKHGIGFITSSCDALYVSIVLELFQKGNIGIIIADMRKCAGLNLPVRSVVLLSDSAGEKYDNNMLPAIQQALSRAGRRGFDSRAYWYIMNGNAEKYRQILSGKLAPLHCDMSVNIEQLRAFSSILSPRIMTHLRENLFYSVVNDCKLNFEGAGIYCADDAYFSIYLPELMGKLDEIKLFCAALQSHYISGGGEINIPQIVEKVLVVEDGEEKMVEVSKNDIKRANEFVPDFYRRLLLGIIYRDIYTDSPPYENIFPSLGELGNNLAKFGVMDGFPTMNNLYYRLLCNKQIPSSLSRLDVSVFKVRAEKILTILQILYKYVIIPTKQTDIFIGFVFEALYNGLERYIRDHHRP